MVEITFVHPDGNRRTVGAAPGTSIMQAARDNGINEIIAECGGAMACATCHCYVDDAWTDRVGHRDDAEDDMLDFAEGEVRDTSRLSCQIALSEALDGVIVHLPDVQG
ncbi:MULTISPECIES: 2Fe-2S iron-sulfur cluster-binding protein [Mameliella]|uniref:2Fe-2S iron-sulfur cluster-binding protein n=1 Tax=Mameliella TaxID=1434019 RepID=UPI000B52ED2F|nr:MULTISPECIES: 2Fe-2S iron-sulfur cluster-binding protein [Mameliella]MCR9272881.1 2Fe-2S iron-sulfur cluster-binding protein [Paracoccaceae bacterium]OWV57425.1 (2Fe-2S)-binding protein [Mameliella alba]